MADDSELPLDPELFFEWRSPRIGSSNPETLTNPVWEWLVKSGVNAYQANRLFSGPSALGAGPGWCFERFGQSSTQLADGRVVLIGGEHEDHYDPDFYIYNDVVVRHPGGRIDIYGYPREVFPPTDFHSATLLERRVVIIGCLGYPANRKPGTTPVFVLDLETFSIAPARCRGTAPGWIHSHRARLSEDGKSILIEGGKLDRGENSSLLENIDDWQLRLADWEWVRLSDRRWPRWEVRRSDGKPNQLWNLEQALWAQKYPDIEAFQRSSEGEPVRDLPLYERRYAPPVGHDTLPAVEDEYGVHRIRVQGVVVRYVEDMYSVQMTVEGGLATETVDALAQDLRDKLSALEGAACELIPI